jgi:hypothetical protein
VLGKHLREAGASILWQDNRASELEAVVPVIHSSKHARDDFVSILGDGPYGSLKPDGERIPAVIDTPIESLQLCAIGRMDPANVYRHRLGLEGSGSSLL